MVRVFVRIASLRITSRTLYRDCGQSTMIGLVDNPSESNCRPAFARRLIISARDHAYIWRRCFLCFLWCDTLRIFMPPCCPAGPPGADSAFGAALPPPAPEAPPLPAPCAAAYVQVPASRAAASTAANFVFMSDLR